MAQRVWLDETPHKPFALPGATPHYTPDRPVQVEHIALDLELDIEAETVTGTCSLRLRSRREGVTQLRLDAVDLQIDQVSCNGAAPPYQYDGEVLLVDVTLAIDAVLELVIRYRLEQPRRGIYFIKPTAAYPDKPVQVWTQGEDEDSRYWFPCFDYPGQLASSEIAVTVATPYVVVSNGELMDTRAASEGRKRWHWRQAQVHPTYLMALAVGDFAVLEDQWQDRPVTYYVEKGREEQARLTMGKTPQMIAFFSEWFGYTYPYPKYAQVCVDDFIFGGMENTSITILTDRCLLDATAQLEDRRSETLVSHELAHQWFGDLIVIRHWAHAWVKEGMATYAETLWDEFDYDRDTADYHRYDDQQSYISEDSSRYRRPLVTNIYKEAIELYDRHIYEKGACVYHMIRHKLGDTLFKQAIQTLLTRHAHQTVDTHDLIQAIDQATGHNLLPLFDQYVFRGGHPEFTISLSHDNGLAAITVKQNKDLLFDLEIPIAIGYDQGKTLNIHTVRVQEAQQTFYFPSAQAPEFISFDHGNAHLKTVTLELSVPQLSAQLRYAPDAIARLTAAQALGKKGNLAAIKALADALAQEAFWGVRVEIVNALAGINLNATEPVLQTALKDSNPHVRKAAISALAKSPSAARYALIKPLAEEPCYGVAAAAASALGSMGGSVLVDLAATAYQDLVTILETQSGWNEVVRSGAVRGLAALNEHEAALDTLLQTTALGVPQPLRLAAIRALGTYAARKENQKVLQRLQELAQEEFFLTQVAVVSALGQLNTTAAIPVLQSLDTADGRISRMISETIAKVQAKAGSTAAVDSLRKELETLKESNQTLLSRLAALEAQVAPDKN